MNMHKKGALHKELYEIILPVCENHNVERIAGYFTTASWHSAGGNCCSCAWLEFSAPCSPMSS